MRDRVARARLDEDPAREVPPADTRDRGAPAQVMELERAEDRLLAAVERKRQELAKKLKTLEYGREKTGTGSGGEP